MVILKVTLLKIHRLLPMATINMHMKFGIEILKQTYAPETMSSTDRRTDGQTDGRTRWIQYTPPPTSLSGGIISFRQKRQRTKSFQIEPDMCRQISLFVECKCFFDDCFAVNIMLPDPKVPGIARSSTCRHDIEHVWWICHWNYEIFPIAAAKNLNSYWFILLDELTMSTLEL